ncbi:hypothetical protein KAX75_13300, partial [candidate division WOR-3 bacterium]|nr:hypothetical protein [candidate division WOR-3 bacterium]
MKNPKKLILSGIILFLFSANLFAQAPDTLWTKTIGGKNEDWGFSVQQTSDDGYIIAGWTNSFGAGLNDVYLIKTEPDVGVEEDKKDQRPKTTDIRLFCCPNPFTTEVSI